MSFEGRFYVHIDLFKCGVCHLAEPGNLENVPILVDPGNGHVFSPLCECCVNSYNKRAAENHLPMLVVVPGTYWPVFRVTFGVDGQSKTIDLSGPH